MDLPSLERRSDVDEALAAAVPNDTVRSFLLQNLKHRDGGFTWEPNLDLLYGELETVMGFPDAAGAVFGGPVLWIRGDRSNYVTDGDAPAMRALFPNCLLYTSRCV